MIPSMVSHYRILQKLATGGMGEIYLGEDIQLRRKVAIKFLRSDSVGNETAHKRLMREAQAAARLDHPHICSVYEVGREADQTFIVMAYVEGETLASRMKRRPLELQQSLAIAVQVSNALAEAHSHGIVHRDIKPLNIMISSNGDVKVMDFGLAKNVETEQIDQSDAETESRLTGTGRIVGTTAYMSPEQVRGDNLDARTDIFSFGVVLYEMISGSHPFVAESAAETVSAILTRDPYPLSRYSKDVSTELERIVAKAVRKNREERYQTMKDMALDLKSLQQEKRDTFVVQPAVTSKKHSFPWKAVLPAVAFILLLLVFILNIGDLRSRMLTPTDHETIQSIAVLPLENLSKDSAEDYFADGMTETLITELAKIKALRVISRTSIMQYKGARKPLPEIAKQLKVDAIIEGSVLRSGDKVRITAQLIHASSDRHLWAEQFDRDLRDVLSLQREVARTIAKKIGINLTQQEKTLLANFRPIQPQANEAYLKGLHYFNDGINKPSYAERGPLLKQSMEYFEQAIEMEPDYASAYAGLASANHWWASSGYPEFYPKAKDAALKALQIDETLAEAHQALAFTIQYLDWDWNGTEAHYKKAIELSPSLGNGHHGYALYLSAVGRHEEAIAEIKRAEELDPLTLPLKKNAGLIYLYARQYDRAIEKFRSIQKVNPQYLRAESGIGSAYLFKKMCPEALSSFRKVSEASGNSTEAELLVAWADSSCGRKTEALQMIEKLKDTSKPYRITLAAIYTSLGDKDNAFSWLQKAYDERDFEIAFINVIPQFDSLHSDPRFQQLLQRLRVPSV